MRKEQEIFTQVNKQNVPVSADILDTLEQEVVNESVLRKYVRSLLTEQSMSDEEKIIMLFFKESSRLGIQMAAMTPGLESLAEDLDNFRDQVDGFVDKVEGLVSQGKYQKIDLLGDMLELTRLRDQIEWGAVRLVDDKQLTSKEPSDALWEWENELSLLWDGIRIAISPGSVRWNDKMKTKLDDLKDWARES